MKVYLLQERGIQGDLDVRGVFASHIDACKAAGDPEPPEIPFEGPREFDDYVVQPWDLAIPADMNPALELARAIRNGPDHTFPQSEREADRYLSGGLIKLALWLDQDVSKRAEATCIALIRLLAIVN